MSKASMGLECWQLQGERSVCLGVRYERNGCLRSGRRRVGRRVEFACIDRTGGKLLNPGNALWQFSCVVLCVDGTVLSVQYTSRQNRCDWVKQPYSNPHPVTMPH